MSKKKGFIIIIVINLFLFCFDFISTVRLGDLVEHLEANPLYRFIGLAGIVFLNCLVFAVAWLWYEKSKDVNARHTLILCFVLLAFVRVLVIVSNWQIGSDPPTVEQAQAITQTAKDSFYFLKVYIPALTYFLVSQVTFILFRVDHEVSLK